ncbi:hypothetical protein FIBSPDRAFT_942245 [Athelia psychrophila]|uniref:Uncharacterized protein n=1 Tax=Athelia psychrophila TaxID=1759441 RepID=A0A167SL52_9AGAM|nr:hypothetical protein FIBSPDRAFT_942245 [Fibularhizoctonia sp. CBS 109695]
MPLLRALSLYPYALHILPRSNSSSASKCPSSSPPGLEQQAHAGMLHCVGNSRSVDALNLGSFTTDVVFDCELESVGVLLAGRAYWGRTKENAPLSIAWGDYLCRPWTPAMTAHCISESAHRSAQLIREGTTISNRGTRESPRGASDFWVALCCFLDNRESKIASTSGYWQLAAGSG